MSRHSRDTYILTIAYEYFVDGLVCRCLSDIASTDIAEKKNVLVLRWRPDGDGQGGEGERGGRGRDAISQSAQHDFFGGTLI